MPWAQIGVQTLLHAGLRFGQAKHVDRTLERLFGRRPHSRAQYFHDHREFWGREVRNVAKPITH
jgi:hypothetical protein